MLGETNDFVKDLWETNRFASRTRRSADHRMYERAASHSQCVPTSTFLRFPFTVRPDVGTTDKQIQIAEID